MLELDTPHPNTVAAKGLRPGPEVDLEALGAHYKRTYARLHMHAVSIVGSSDLADDIVQEAFAITTAKIKQGAEIRNLNAWMKTVVRNLSIDGLARKGRERRTFSPLPDEPRTVAPASPAEIAHVKQRCKAVYREVGRLTPAQRSAFVLAELRGLNSTEIASDLQRTEQAVRDLLSRARHRIREAVGQDLTSVITPLASLEVAKHLAALKGWARGLREQILAKLTDLRQSIASLYQRSADLIAQPATPLAAGALVVVALGGAPANEMSPAQPAQTAAPAVAAVPAPAEPPDGRSAGKAPRAAGDAEPPVVTRPEPADHADPGARTDKPQQSTGEAPKPNASGGSAGDTGGAAPLDSPGDTGGQPGGGEPPPPPPGSCDGRAQSCYAPPRSPPTIEGSGGSNDEPVLVLPQVYSPLPAGSGDETGPTGDDGEDSPGDGEDSPGGVEDPSGEPDHLPAMTRN